jgi:hypothetical protein
MALTISGGITLSGQLTIGNTGFTGFTITSADILGTGSPIYQNTIALGPNGVDGFENTAPQFGLYEGYTAYNLSPALATAITNYVTAQGINPNNNQGYVYNVTWGADSTIGSGLAKLGFYSGNGDPANAYINIQTIDPTDLDYQQNNTNNGTSLTGRFFFPATFTIYSPLTDKNNWC